MSQALLPIGEFAKLAETTKRTVLWYEELNLLKPTYINPETGYRFYATSQIIDFKAILLLRKLNFSLAEIKAKNQPLKKLFKAKEQVLERELADLEANLTSTRTYYANLEKTGTLVNPKIKVFKPFPVYYVDKLGPYRLIDNYFTEFRTYFKIIPKGVLGLVLYEDVGYQPKNARVKICFTIKAGLELKKDTPVKKMVVPGFKALAYTHQGSTKLLSILWQELKKYQVKYGYKLAKNLPFEDAEMSKNKHVTEMLMPIQ